MDEICLINRMTKGKRVRFIAGKYGGKSGWIDLDRPEGDGAVLVIVDLGRKGEKNTYVYVKRIFKNASQFEGVLFA